VLPPPIRVTIVAASLYSAWPTLLSGVDRKVRSMMGAKVSSCHSRGQPTDDNLRIRPRQH
jgi:hypothetical protein